MKTKKQTPLFKFILCGLFFFSTFYSFAFSPPNKSLKLADINIIGKVTSSENNEPLVGVSIRVEGTDKGTITDVDGNFALTTPSDAVLLFTFIGFETQKMAVNNQSVINISLMNSASALSELVVIGYGSATKKDMTGAVKSLKNSEFNRGIYTSTDPNLRATWNFILQGLSRSVTAIQALPDNKDPSAKVFLAEARGMRAYYSMLTLDLFGLVFVKENSAENSKILRGSDAVEYIKSELLAVEPNLDATVGPGRLSKGAAWGLLARLYLNAAVYRDVYADKATFKSEDMDKVLEYCDKIIMSNQYTLSKDYFSIFGSDNHDNKELIFAVDQRADLNGHNRMAYFSISGDQFPLPAFPNANGTDRPGITPDFYRHG